MGFGPQFEIELGLAESKAVVNVSGGREIFEFLGQVHGGGFQHVEISVRKFHVNRVAAGRADGVIRAAPEHEITVISEDGYRTELMTGIGFMKVDLNLIVG